MKSATSERLTSSAIDETAIRDLFQKLIESWNRGDGETYAAGFTEDADYIAFDGTHFKGRRVIAVTHQQLFDTHLKGTRFVGQVTGLRFVSPDVVLIHAIGGTIMQAQSTPAPKRDSIQALVAVRHHDDWLFAAFHNTRIRPIGRSVGGTLVWIMTDWLWKLFRSRK